MGSCLQRISHSETIFHGGRTYEAQFNAMKCSWLNLDKEYLCLRAFFSMPIPLIDQQHRSMSCIQTKQQNPCRIRPDDRRP